MGDAYTPIRGKCTWWREQPVEEDEYDRRIADDDRRIRCSCFVEGFVWTYATSELPSDCPDANRCRYHILHS